MSYSDMSSQPPEKFKFQTVTVVFAAFAVLRTVNVNSYTRPILSTG
jgi:hypothetical protein